MPNELFPEEYYKHIKQILEESRDKAYKAASFVMVCAYWEIGKCILEMQGGFPNADYGEKLIEQLSIRLTRDFGKGFTPANLRFMRRFYSLFSIRDTLCPELSWSHYRLLIRVENEEARNYYLEEAVKSSWSVRQLQRQINTFSYQRLLASHGDKRVVEDTASKAPASTPLDIIKDPYVLEFLGIEPNSSLYESDLEQGLIDHLQKFLLELGRGYSFIARQKHISIDGRHFYIDLVFYNYILKCFVLIDLKTGDLTHQDIGQMQMYVNYYARDLSSEGDNPPIGIILCSDKSDSIVRYTLPEGDNSIFASKYSLYIPNESELKKELLAGRRILESNMKSDSQ